VDAAERTFDPAAMTPQALADLAFLKRKAAVCELPIYEGAIGWCVTIIRTPGAKPEHCYGLAPATALERARKALEGKTVGAW
jgi:hypothetical protein